MIPDELLIDAAREVIETSAGTAVREARRGNGIGADFKGVIAFLSFTGSCAGTLALLCEPSLASALTGGMLGMPAEEIETDMVADAVGELLNQVAGTVKRKLAANGDEIMLSVPSVVSGAPIALKVLASALPVAADLTTERGVVHVRFWIPN